MPGGGSKPGQRRGGRKKGTPNKRTIGEVSYESKRQEAQKEAAKPHLDSLDQMQVIAGTLVGMAAQAQRSEKPDNKWIKELLEAAGRAYTAILPYEHRRLATLEPAMETVVKPDGT